MKKLLLAGIAAAAFCSAPALAADMALKAPLLPPVPVYNWTGWYVGGNIGYSWGNANSNYNEPIFSEIGLPVPISESQKLDGVIGGGQIGYNWQANPTWVFGLEADFQGSGEKGSSSVADPYGIAIGPALTLTDSTNVQWFGTVRGRIGVLVNPTTLLYGNGGLAYGRISTSGTVNEGFVPGPTWSFGDTTTKVGWTVGGGIEGAIPNTRNWTWKLEYLYIDFGTVSGNNIDSLLNLGQFPYSWSTKVTDNIFRGGLNYRFQ